MLSLSSTNHIILIYIAEQHHSYTGFKLSLHLQITIIIHLRCLSFCFIFYYQSSIKQTNYNMINNPLLTHCAIILIATLLIHTTAQLSCSNLYNQNNLPPQCYNNNTCIFPPFSNTSLIINNTTDNLFGLCIDLPAYTITIQQGSDVLNISVYVNCLSIEFQSGYELQSKDSLVVQSSSDISLSNTTMGAAFIWLQSNQIYLANASIVNDNSFNTDCDCTSKATVCTAPKYDFPFLYSQIKYPSPFNITLMNYTFQNWIFIGQGTNSAVLYARSNITISNSTIRISVIAIYSTILTITNSNLDNSGLGYSSGTGLGCGYFDQILNQLLGCTGTGASHGGYGGNSQPENCNLLLSRPPYDREFIPKYPGSGGGFFLKSLTEVSAGGGVINIQVQNLIIQSSNIRADGTNGIQGGGGGSGGSVSIDFLNVQIINAPNISANGGAGKSSGGGGRIRYFYHGWNRVDGNLGTNNNNLVVVANGGDCIEGKLSCGQRGSIDVAPCPPGYFLNYTNYGCSMCSNGTYQLTYSYSNCSQCSTKPANSYYNPSIFSIADLSNYTQVCNFKCIDDYSIYNNRQCLSKFDDMLVDVGGINIIICIGIIVATIVIYLIILMVRKLSFSDRNIFNQLQPVDIYRKKSYFKIEDIPFHQMRIFFEGYNSPSNPWRIHQKVQAKLSELEEYHSNFPFFSRLIREINLIGEYNRPTKWLLYILKFTYYPLGLFLASAFRVHKSKQLRKLIVDKYKENTELHLGIKLHVNTQHTIASLQLFNFQKETLDFYIKNYFPIYFKLQKLHGGGYSIDLTDPIFKSLCNEFEEKDEKNIKLEDYLIELNQLLRNSDQELPIFKHLWKIHNAWPFLQCHLWQPENNILGVGDNMRIDKSQDLFLVFSTEPRPQNLAININQSLPSSQLILQNSRGNQNKVSQHFLSRNELPNIYFDEISCIRHKYHLREAMIEMDQKKTIFWQIENSFSEKSLSWILGAIDILQLLLNLLSFFLVVFSLDQQKNSYAYVYIPYFVLFPFCEYFMIFLEFNLLISRVTRVFTFALYFTLFSLVKFLILCIIILAIAVPDGNQDTIFIINFFLWIMILIFNVVSLILLCMLQTHYVKVK